MKRIVFMGTPSFSVPILEALIEKYNVCLVVCQPDKEKDKKGNIIIPSVKEVALRRGIECFQPISIRSDYQKILDSKPDIIITCAYGQIIPDILLNYPKYGAINVHGSLLPLLRGGAPIHWAIINGYKETGITIMYMDSKMDNGDIISQRAIPILDSDNLDSLYNKMSLLGRDLLLDTLPSIFEGSVARKKQDESLVSFGLNIKKSDKKINFNDDALNIWNLVRGLCSNPSAYCLMDGKILKVFDVEILNDTYRGSIGEIVDVLKKGFVVKCRDGSLLIKEICLEGKKRVKCFEYLNGIKKESIIGIILR